MKMKYLFMAALLLMSMAGMASGEEPTDTTKVWQHFSPAKGIQGVSTEEAYAFLKEKGRKSEPIIVAIIDSGTDIEHEDLKGELWVNEGEIAGDGIDNDKNGYVDDVHGWNFIGGKNGKNLDAANMEVTRLYRKGKAVYGGKDISEMKTEAEKEAFLKYAAIKKKYEKSVDKAKMEFTNVMSLWALDSLLAKALKKDDYTIEDLKNVDSSNQMLAEMSGHMIGFFESGFSRDDIKEWKKYVETKVLYQLNLDFDPRPEIIGDDPLNASDSNYGNNDVIGSSADHGTHVAGIVAATRGNGIGMDGIANNVKLMIVRTIPDGDERDKDVANAIKYAVNNGAKIINMSFGKSTTTLKSAVDDALKLAEEKGVLLVHAAGNDGKNIDKHPNYPTPILDGTKKPLKNWLTVGASGQKADSSLVADFSNYGRKHVDIFAPGVDVYSAYPHNKYKKNSGTSMAAPVVTGVAALVWSHYPQMTAKDLKKLLMKSSIKLKKLKINRPVSEEEKESQRFEADKVLKFKKLSRTGGVVNALEAVKMAEKKFGK